VVVFAVTWTLNWGLLAVWAMMLAGVVGGKVLLYGSRSARLFYLAALGFLVTALLLNIVPAAVPKATVPQPMLWLSLGGLPLTLLFMALLPQTPEQDVASEVVDFVYSLFVFLLLAVLILGCLAAMIFFRSGYIEAVLQSLFLMSFLLMVLGWVWNPHAGFSGLGSLFSRYLMSIGLPVEQWLQALADLALREEQPERFVEQACTEMTKRLSWVTGGQWIATTHRGSFGRPEGERSEFSHPGLTMVLYTRQTLSPTLLWHFNLMAQLLAEFHADKQRAVTLKQLSYMQAIHETGARLTHDVKNLLQSLNGLCAAVKEPGALASPGYHALLQRQLPAISSRLSETLNKLMVPEESANVTQTAAALWWQELQRRFGGLPGLTFAGAPGPATIPAEVFSGVTDNLIRNFSEKRLREPDIKSTIRWEADPQGDALEVCDDGSPVPDPIAQQLLSRPVQSDSGLGIGLYHAARHAASAGYLLEMTENRAGRVCFRLSPLRSAKLA